MDIAQAAWDCQRGAILILIGIVVFFGSILGSPYSGKLPNSLWGHCTKAQSYKRGSFLKLCSRFILGLGSLL